MSRDGDGGKGNRFRNLLFGGAHYVVFTFADELLGWMMLIHISANRFGVCVLDCVSMSVSQSVNQLVLLLPLTSCR